MIVSRVLAFGGMGLLLLLGTACPSGITENTDDAGLDGAQKDRPQQDAPPFFEDAKQDDGGTGDGPAPDGTVQSDGSVGEGGPCYPEPDESVGGDTCATSLPRPSADAGIGFSPPAHITVSGNLWPAADVDYYQLIFQDTPTAANCGKFKVRINFTQNPGDHFRFDVLTKDCVTPATCQTFTVGDAGVDLDAGIPTGGLTSFTLNGAGACPCAVPPTPTSDTTKVCNDYSVELRIRVFRKSGAPVVCENYELSIDNG